MLVRKNTSLDEARLRAGNGLVSVVPFRSYLVDSVGVAETISRPPRETFSFRPHTIGTLEMARIVSGAFLSVRKPLK
jgi:hypothetical protein